MRARLLLVWVALTCSVSAIEAKPRPLFKTARAEVAFAEVRGDRTLDFVVAAARGQSTAVARVVVQAGGTVLWSQVDVDYLAVRLPLSAVKSFAALPVVEAVDIDMSRPSGRWWAYHGQAVIAPTMPTALGRREWVDLRDRPQLVPVQSGAPDLPFRQPHGPSRDIAATEFKQTHPMWDGRGVTIAFIEGGTADLLMPQIQPAIKDILTTADPLAQGPRTAWIRMGRIDAATGYRRGTAHLSVREVFAGGGTQTDFSVLWDSKRNRVWVDTDRDGDFRDERDLTDYAIRREFGVLGEDNPATALRESMAFAVQTSQEHLAVAILLGRNDHLTPLVGAALGVAPAAQIITIDPGGNRPSDIARALIRAMTDRRIDIVSLSMKVGDDAYHPRDSRSVVSILVDRLMTRFPRKLLFFGAGNATHNLGTVHEMPAKAIAVSAYEAGESYRKHWGIVPRAMDNLHPVGAGGPAWDGRLRPDLLAPSNFLAPFPGFLPGEELPGVYQLPPGYTISGGTSTATPVAAGAAALLISAAKQQGIHWNADDVRQALVNAARYLDGIGAYQQGHGLIQVEPAWGILRRMVGAPLRSRIKIAVRGPVHHALSRWLSEPGQGSGLLEVEGWKLGDHRSREIELTRVSGPSRPIRLNLEWRGNDGTFASSDSVILPRNRPVPVEVRIAPSRKGVLSALLEIREPQTGMLLQRVAFAVVVPEQFAAPEYAVTIDDVLSRPGTRELYFNVPAGVGLFRLHFNDRRRKMWLTVTRMDGRTPWYGFGWETKPGLPGSYFVLQPTPGIYRVQVHSDPGAWHHDQTLDEPLAALPFVLTASIHGVSMELQGNGIRLQNRFAPFEGGLVSAALASGRVHRDRIAPGERRSYTLTVPPGTSQLLARTAHVSDPQADLDVYLFDCTEGQCRSVEEVGASAETNDEQLRVVAPKAGTWILVVDAPTLTKPAVSYEMHEFIVNPRYGMVGSADDLLAVHTQGSVWDVPLQIWQSQTSLLEPQRFLSAILTVEATGARRHEALPPERLPLAWMATPVASGALLQ